MCEFWDMPKFKQVALKPGRYRVGFDSNGGPLFRDVTKDQLAKYVNGTNELLKTGQAPPVLLEHAEPGTADGAPRDKAANNVKHGVGWLSSVAIGDDGAAVYELDIRDKAIADKLRDGSIKFTSPECRDSWCDGLGRTFDGIFSHVALTHKPRNPEQSAFVEVPEPEAAMQFSLADYVGPIQFSEGDMDDDKKPDDVPADDPKPSNEPPPNPDLEAGAKAAEKQKLEAILVLLKEVAGADLPADSEWDASMMDNLLTALKTVKAAKEAASVADVAEDVQDDSREIEMQQPLQFSLEQVVADDFTNKLLARCIKADHQALRTKLNTLVSRGLPPAFRDKLLADEKTLQFSNEGDEVPSLTVRKVVDLCETLVDGIVPLTQCSTQFGNELEHPNKDFFKQPDAPADSAALVDSLFPHLSKKK